MYAFIVTVSVVGLLQRILLNTITHIYIEQYDAMLHVNKNSNIKYNIIQVKLN